MSELISVRHIGSWARETFWLLLPEVHLTAGGLLFAGGPESARSVLSSITSAMITMTGLVFSVTIVALQLAAGQFSSRVMRDFLSDRVIQVTFGTFVATFTYTMIMQRSVRGITGGRDPVVPQLGLTVAFALVMVSIALFVVYINRIANSIRIANIVARIGVRTRATIEVRYPVQAPPEQSAAPVGPPTHYVTAHRPGVIVSINEQALVALSARAGSVLILVPRIGDYVPAGARVFGVYGEHPGDAALLRHVAFDTERTYEQDVAFGFRELVDIAERALSPAVNDPTTAAQAIDICTTCSGDSANDPLPPDITSTERASCVCSPTGTPSATCSTWHWRKSPTTARATSRLRGAYRHCSSTCRAAHYRNTNRR